MGRHKDRLPVSSPCRVKMGRWVGGDASLRGPWRSFFFSFCLPIIFTRFSQRPRVRERDWGKEKLFDTKDPFCWSFFFFLMGGLFWASAVSHVGGIFSHSRIFFFFLLLVVCVFVCCWVPFDWGTPLWSCTHAFTITSYKKKATHEKKKKNT